jgi:hypothetical protein
MTMWKQQRVQLIAFTMEIPIPSSSWNLRTSAACQLSPNSILAADRDDADVRMKAPCGHGGSLSCTTSVQCAA